VILANSITLTPGTITVSLTDDHLLVHCLDKSLAEGMDDSVFVRLLQKMEEI
jgi:multicomponent Na+:H+ antiporter subunit E